MTKAQLLGLTKAELINRFDFRCKHGHNGIRHIKCYEKKNHKPIERIGFADIETSNLKADFGMVYTWCIKEKGGPLYRGSITYRDLQSGLLDKNVVGSFVSCASGFDRLIFHYGENTRFDIPFLRTRAVRWGIEFQKHRDLFVSDTYPILKNKFKLRSNRLQAACQLFEIKSKGHPLDLHIWAKMQSGNKRMINEALKYIMSHNIEDVESLEALWEKISPYTQIGRSSI